MEMKEREIVHTVKFDGKKVTIHTETHGKIFPTLTTNRNFARSKKIVRRVNNGKLRE